MALSATSICLWPENALEKGIGIAIAACVPNWQRVESVLGETIREVGVLIVVFAPLEATFTDVSVSTGRVIAMVLFGLVLIASGIIMEVRN
jgi:hypothetical protein